MTLFCRPEQARLQTPESDWLYLGKDPWASARLEYRLGKPPRPLGNRLHEEVRGIRKPFLELLADLGKGKDPAAWWAGALSGRAWDFSDFFLLCGYLSLSLRLAAEPGALTVVVEDPWLLEQLQDALKGSPKASVGAPSCLFTERLRCLFLGLARRLKWSLRMKLGFFVQLAYWLTQPGAAPRDGILIYSHLVPRSLKPEGRWDDPFLSGLDTELAAEGAASSRLTYSDITGLEAEVARRKSCLIPAILWWSLGGYIRALTALPPALPLDAKLSGMPVGRLLEREWWHDFARAARCAYLFFFDCVENLLSKSSFKALAMPWEAQPQERMLALAAQRAGVRSVGCQHTTVPEFQLPFYSTAEEYRDSPTPDILIASGEHPASMLRSAGFPAERIRVGGTRRYAHFLQDGAFPRPRLGPDVLIMLPVDAWHARHLIAAVARAYPDGLPGGKFLLRPHPSGPEDVRRTPFPSELAEGPMNEVLSLCGVAVFSGSTAGLDALCAGHPVLRYRPSLLLDMEPTDMFPEEFIADASDSDLRERLESLRRDPRPLPEEALRRKLKEVFSPLDKPVWKDALLSVRGQVWTLDIS